MNKQVCTKVAAGMALGLCAFGVLPTAATAATPVAATEKPAEYVYDLEAGYTNDPVAQAKLDEITALLPAGWQDRAEEASARVDSNDGVMNAIQRALNPDDYECSSTPLQAYVDSLVARAGRDTVYVLSKLGALNFPTYDALFYGSATDPDYALRAEAKDITKTFSQTKKFFDTPTDDIQLMAMHGDMMVDPARVGRMVEYFYGMPLPAVTDKIVEIVDEAPALNDGDFPLFTLNAYAFTAAGDDDPDVQGVPDKLVFGDGMIEAIYSLGYADVGPQAIVGHEMAHHVQYERNVFGPVSGPEETRRTELMADALGTYFLTHKRGATLQAKRVVEATLSFSAIGDCGFTDPGHHGTPNQRKAASQWGANLAATTWPKGHILGTQELITRFDGALPEIVRPDAR